ncbi:3-oxoacyl-[acyl-carrier protein] reductase [Anaerosolibacter carboniphilus]|uniref:3-oxoacyl-[acyl-carrier protein] reductase n=1 Tax=Anaerosolibacter carboniphilus TaxID=1417629 RepID=A0A841L239_9FIRM|nr:SDR family oxidoreductase [Anaerosolibacter carboniphilus]MBB6216425.1 3-oxoacyl-[acyl-carrier protein] reductase [Anaerosolibacter carboniphilus]
MKENPSMIITGTSKGIGRGIAQYFLSKGYTVFGCSRSASTLEEPEYFHSQVDITDYKQVRTWISSIRKVSPSIDVLICNAGIAPASTLLTMMSGDLVEKVMSTNIGGTYYVCQEVAKQMVRQRSGRIITISSMAVGLHLEGTSAYAASKSAVVEMTKILAKELAPFNITCNTLAPSMMMTDAVEVLGDEIISHALNKLTIKRKLTIDEICNVLSFFIAPQSACITGQVIHMGLVN